MNELPAIPVDELRQKSAIAVWLLEHLREQKETFGAEVGVKQGRLASMLLRSCNHLSLYLVDRWTESGPDEPYRQIGDPAGCASQASYNAWYDETIQRMAEFPGRTIMLKGEATKMAARLAAAGRKLDFVFIDSDHSFDNRLRDLRDWSALVVPGGFVAGGLLYSSFGGGCGRLALEAWLAEARPDLPYERGPAQTWLVRL